MFTRASREPIHTYNQKIQNQQQDIIWGIDWSIDFLIDLVYEVAANKAVNQE